MDEEKNDPRHQAVLMRECGMPASEVAKKVHLSMPTVISLHKAYIYGGWSAVDAIKRGRPKTSNTATSGAPANIAQAFAEHTTQAWNIQLLARWLSSQAGKELNERAALRKMHQWGWMSSNLSPKAGQISLALHQTPNKGLYFLFARPSRGKLMWVNLTKPPTDNDYCNFFELIFKKFDAGFAVSVPLSGLQYMPELRKWLATHPNVELTNSSTNQQELPATEVKTMNTSVSLTNKNLPSGQNLTHLQRLEAESIHIMREVVATCDNPVMLYSIGKDSAVMLHIALKAFYPAKLPFPLLHVDTGWKFKDMYAFRDRMQAEHNFKLLVHQNPDGIAMGINPFTHGSQIHTDIMKTQGLKQALDHYQFDAAFGGARRDEEKSRAKERIFSFRNAQHRWDPKNQRPELWNIYNTHKNKGESLRVFPISNWTELDIWQYIYLENIPIVPLYFSKERPVVERDGALIMVDDDRMPLATGEVPMLKKVRFRTLGCYPLTGAVESDSQSLPEIIQEMLLTKTSERQGRVIDHDTAASMEKKKQEGYF
jgi:sulfate adenylyltransferase subunit 2